MRRGESQAEGRAGTKALGQEPRDGLQGTAREEGPHGDGGCGEGATQFNGFMALSSACDHGLETPGGAQGWGAEGS